MPVYTSKNIKCLETTKNEQAAALGMRGASCQKENAGRDCLLYSLHWQLVPFSMDSFRLWQQRYYTRFLWSLAWNSLLLVSPIGQITDRYSVWQTIVCSFTRRGTMPSKNLGNTFFHGNERLLWWSQQHLLQEANPSRGQRGIAEVYAMVIHTFLRG